MLTEEEKALMRDSLHALRAGLPGFSTRRPQLQMIAAVAHALAELGAGPEWAEPGDRIAVVEAGTGTGKTIGYLLPALVLAHLRGCKLVVSSSTVALQEQLATKDLPALQRHLPFAFRCALAKGRRRYVCPAKLVRLEAQRPVAATDGVQAPQEARPVRLVGRLEQAFSRGSWSGDRDDWPGAIPDGLWQRISTDREGCLGARCAEYARCPFQAAREALEEADVIVTNHDLLLAALDMEAGALLPDPAETMFVLDEAHGLPAKAAAHTAARHAVLAAARWTEDVGAFAAEAGHALRLDRTLPQQVAEQAGHLGAALDTLHAGLGRHCRFEGTDADAVHRFIRGVLPQDLADLGAGVRQAAIAMQAALTGLREGAMERAKQDAAAAQPHVAALGAYLGHLQPLIATWDAMLQPSAENGRPMARWIERVPRAGGPDDFRVCAAPISGGQRLHDLLWARAGAAVLTSATLRACGSFDLFLEDSGLQACPGVRALSLPSPFDYAAQAELHLPPMRTHPRDADAHSEEVAALLPALLEAHQGALVLFASGRQMQRVAQGLPEALRAQVLVQGAMSKRELLAQHRARIDQDQRSVLFGLASLSEGVDLPGAYCTHLIVAKLPFAVPDDPVEQARREWLEGQGRSAFLERAVPEVGIRLAQAVGRLLRAPEDHGIVTVLDPRLGATAWGRRLLAGLPPFRLVRGRAATPDRQAA